LQVHHGAGGRGEDGGDCAICGSAREPRAATLKAVAPRLLATYGSVSQAEMARSVLRAAGIDADIVDSEMVGLNWMYSIAVGGVKLVVAEEDFEAATAVLSEFASATIVDDEPTPPVEPRVIAPKVELRCPECGSAESIRIRRLLVFSLLALLMYGVGLVGDQQELALAGILAAALIAAVLPSRRCASCGTRWPDEDADDEDEIHAPPPDASDLVEVLCPRCSSPEFHRIDYRKLKVLPLMFSASAFVVPLIWPFLAKRECDNCGFRR
jgi:hypothetical protein